MQLFTRYKYTSKCYSNYTVIPLYYTIPPRGRAIHLSNKFIFAMIQLVVD